MSYTIKLPQFEGPFDLLLFFIERDELDIYNIPIAKITNDFLAYISDLEALDIDVASEFILVASTLMRIKSKLLLPRQEVDEDGNEIDPRQELVERLLEYRKYKAALEELRSLELERSHQEGRGNIINELNQLSQKALADAELENLSLFRLLKAYEQVMLRYKHENEKKIHTIIHFNYTIEEQRDFLVNLVKRSDKVDFVFIFKQVENRLHAIYTFLAMLELLQQGIFEIVIEGEAMNDFEIYLANQTTEEA